MRSGLLFSGMLMFAGATALLGEPILQLDFESPGDFKPGYFQEHYVNPAGGYKTIDDAFGGKTALRLEGNGSITIDSRKIVPGKDYRLSARVKGKGKAYMQIEWLGAGKSSYNVQPLADSYKRIVIDATAPADCNRAYLRFRPDGKDGEMLIDDICFEERIVDPSAPLLDFELPLTGPGNVGKHYVNPSGTYSYDDSGKDAHGGQGAMKLGQKGRITIAYRTVVPGRTYEFSAWVKGSGRGAIQIQWLGKLAKAQLDTKFIDMNGNYQQIRQRAVAPEGSDGMVYLHIFETNSGEMWVDDIKFEEVKKEGDIPALKVSFSGRHERFSVYQPGEEVVVKVAGNALVTTQDTLDWRLCDYLERPVDSGSLALSPQQLRDGVELKYAPKKAGAYFLHLKLRESGATVPYLGSRHPGFVCFGVLPDIAVLPLKSPELSRFGGQGTNFILSGEFMKGKSLDPFYPTTGMRWSYSSVRLSELESATKSFKAKDAEAYRGTPRPETAELDMAEIAAIEGAPKHMLKLPPYMPADAKLKGMEAQSFPLADPEAYRQLFGEAVKDRAARNSVFFSGLAHNYYQIHWEPDWHWQGSEEEFLEFYRLASEAIRANDPKGLLMGANYGVISSGTDKMASLFKKGLGKYIGGVLSHLYFLPVKNEPEQAGLHRDCRRLRRLTDKYISPKAPLINTEWGVDYRGRDTAQVGHDEWMNQLSRFTRGHIIALGEGFNSTWFFYTTDYCTYNSNGGEQGYGISFNTSSYIDKHRFGAASIEPKPTMMGAAAMTRLLEGTRSLGRLDHLPEEVYAYSFRRGDSNLLAVWNPDRDMTLRLPVGVPRVTVYDIMGNPCQLECPDGVLDLAINRFPQYILGVADRVLPTAPRGKDSVFLSALEAVTPGDSLGKVLRSSYKGCLTLRRDGFSRIINDAVLPEDLAIGTYELAALDSSGATCESMLLEIGSSVGIVSFNAETDTSGRPALKVELENRSDKVRECVLSCLFNGREIGRCDVRIPASGTLTASLPAASLPIDGGGPGKLRFELRSVGRLQAVEERRFALALAPRLKTTPIIDGCLDDWKDAHWSRVFGAPDVTYQQKRHRGDKDFSLRYALGSDKDKLYIALEVRDDVLCPSPKEGKPWLGDAVALVLGRDFDGNEEFKSCEYYSFSAKADGKTAVRQIFGTPPKGCFDVPPGRIDSAVRRDEAAGITVYEIAIPKKMFFSGNDVVGLGLNVYDADSLKEVEDDVHRDLPINGGVPLFMGNKVFSVLLFGK